MTLSGLDNLIKQDFKILRNKNIALLCHAASIDSNYEHIISILLNNNLKLKTIFEPEHGIFGAMQDMEKVDKSQNDLIKTVTLYGENYETLFPKTEDLNEIDIVLIDLQDIGSRYYTYVYTASFLLKTAKEKGVPVIVLDRPNPIGDKVEGNLISQGFNSFIGYYKYFLNRHSLTIGEMLSIINKNEINCDLTIIEMSDYKRNYWFEQTKLPFVLPSPNMPSIETEILYPGGCLIEGTNLSEGRGTTKPFHFIGAPFINGSFLKKLLQSHNLNGVAFRDISFKPTFQKHAFKECQGVEIHITNREEFLPLKTYLTIIYEIYHNFKEFKWRTEKYEFVTNPIAIDLLFGNDIIRKDIEAGVNLDTIYKKLTADESDYKKFIKPYLIY